MEVRKKRKREQHSGMRFLNGRTFYNPRKDRSFWSGTSLDCETQSLSQAIGTIGGKDGLLGEKRVGRNEFPPEMGVRATKPLGLSFMLSFLFSKIGEGRRAQEDLLVRHRRGP